MKTKESIYDVIEMGCIVAANEELGIIITVNGSYYNCWTGDVVNGFECTDRRSTGFKNGLYGADFVTVLDSAKEYLDDIMNEVDEDY